MIAGLSTTDNGRTTSFICCVTNFDNGGAPTRSSGPGNVTGGTVSPNTVNGVAL